MDKSELLDKLRTIDEVFLLEILELTSTDLVDAFLDKIDDNIDKVYEKVNEEDSL
jgi:hypothetical protein